MKKCLTPILIFCAFGLMQSQSFKYYKAGQKFTPDDNSCLVIKNNLRLLTHLESLDQYKDIKALKLIGFIDIEFDMDSVFDYLEGFTKIKCLIFENCDLNGLTEPLTFFPALEDVRILKSSFYENSFFPLLKNNNIRSLSIQKEDPGLVTDSLHLLTKLSSVLISNNNAFVTPNKTSSFQYGKKGFLRTVSLSYYGNFYKQNPKTERQQKNAVAKTSIQPKKYSCIKQPIKDIKINDTLFSLNSLSPSSFYYQSGSYITVDKNAFVTQAGAKYNGQVKLFYREFRNPVEIMLSGIPMTNQVNGNNLLFKSGGMYEMSAYDPKGNALNTVSDTCIKINFALTDTSENFQFFSLNDNGSWATTSPSVNIVNKPQKSDSSATVTRAVREYNSYLQSIRRYKADTTDFNSRFADPDYLYTYRKDNLETSKDSVRFYRTYASLFKSKGKCKAIFRVKYLKETKDKDILFTFMLAKNTISYEVPHHIQTLLNTTFVYTGQLSKEDFRKKFNTKLLCWDVRPNSSGENINLSLKTADSFVDLSGKVVTLKNDGTIHVLRKSGKILNTKMQRALASEAKRFNKASTYNNKNRFSPDNKNNLNFVIDSKREKLAYDYCKKYQTPEERKLDFKEWKKYVRKNFPGFYYNSFQNDNLVGSALLKSGLGVKNIDCYLHSGQMEDILVNYNVNADSLSDEYNAMLYKNINTSFPVTRNYQEQSSLVGHYFINNPNYLIRFSENGYMQVTKPNELKKLKKENTVVSLDYLNEYNIKGLTSNDITRLILD